MSAKTNRPDSSAIAHRRAGAQSRPVCSAGSIPSPKSSTIRPRSTVPDGRAVTVTSAPTDGVNVVSSPISLLTHGIESDGDVVASPVPVAGSCEAQARVGEDDRMSQQSLAKPIVRSRDRVERVCEGGR